MGRDPFCIYGTGPFLYPTSILLIKRQAPVLLSIMTYIWFLLFCFCLLMATINKLIVLPCGVRM